VIHGIRMHGYSEKEKAGLSALLRQLQALVHRVGHLVSYRKNLPQAAEPLFQTIELRRDGIGEAPRNAKAAAG
jgi:hypothetical protein